MDSLSDIHENARIAFLRAFVLHLFAPDFVDRMNLQHVRAILLANVENWRRQQKNRAFQSLKEMPNVTAFTFETAPVLTGLDWPSSDICVVIVKNAELLQTEWVLHFMATAPSNVVLIAYTDKHAPADLRGFNIIL